MDLDQLFFGFIREDVLLLKKKFKVSSKLRRRNLTAAVWLKNPIKCFPFTRRCRNLKAQQSPVPLDLCLTKTRSEKSHDYRYVIINDKLRFQTVFCPHLNAKPAFSNSANLKSVSEKLRSRDGLVWMVGLTIQIKLRFKFLRRSLDVASGNENNRWAIWL